MKKKLSKRQLDVMKVLWDHSSPMVASDIVNGSPALNINTVQSCLKVLLKEELIEVADIVYRGTVLSRSYRPLISRDEYFEWKINWPQNCDDCGKYEPQKHWKKS